MSKKSHALRLERRALLRQAAAPGATLTPEQTKAVDAEKKRRESLATPKVAPTRKARKAAKAAKRLARAK